MATDGPKQGDLLEYTARGTQLWILDHLTGINSRMLLTLRAIDNKARGRTTVTMTREQIAKFWLSSIPTVQRGIKELEQAGLLICRRADSHGQCQGASTYQIVWRNLRAIADGESETCEDEEETEVSRPDHHDPLPVHCDPPAVHGDPPPGSLCTAPRITVNSPPDHHDPAYYIPRNNRNNRLLQPYELKAEAAEILKFTGLDSLMSGVQMAIDNGATLEDFREIAEHYRSNPGKWDGPGAVYKKLQEFCPGQPIEQGWPKASSKWQVEQQRQLQAAKLAQERQQREQQSQTSSEAVNELESRYGPVFDAMCDAEVLQFLQQHPHGKFMKSGWDQNKRASRGFRGWILGELAKQFQEAET